MNRTTTRATLRPHHWLLSCALLFAALGGHAWAADPVQPAPAKAKSATTKPATKSTGKRSDSEAPEPVPATEPAEPISDAQLDVATRVLTGAAECEFNQTVSIDAVDGKPGHFLIGFKGKRYLTVPYETTTGTVRLEDRRTGVAWLQIPSKSMLMYTKIGQRLVDACTHAEQRAAVQAVEAAARAGAANTGKN